MLSLYDFQIIILLVLFFLSYSFVLSKIKNKIEPSIPSWKLYIPIYQSYYFVKLSGVNPWTFILLFIPLINVLYLNFIWYKINCKLGYDEFNALFLSSLIMISFGLVSIWLAFKKEEKK